MPSRKSNKNSPHTTRRVRLPDRQDDEMFALVIEIYGGDRMLLKCEDGVTRIGIIRGKIRKRMWCRLGDIVLCIPWDWETKVKGKKEKALIVWRYTRTQVYWLENNGYLNEHLDLNNI
ncbi:MAG: translation initiation factor 1A [Candidatus Lokiarchaeota archaeon]|nr:translation initiation factor 1A [Candidatus Lokiarchaeota archaeon]